MNPFDNSVFHAINQLAAHGGLLATVMIVLAKYSPEMYILILLLGWFTVPWPEVESRHGLVIAVVAAIVVFIVDNIIGAIWFRPRPFVVLPPGSDHQLIQHAADASFPSDHAAVGAALAAGMWGKSRPWTYWVLAALTLLVMVARVYVGVHWPTDVLGGMVVGIAVARAIQPASKLLAPITQLLLRIFRMGSFAKA